jgi:hypothetical protein
VAVYGSSSFWLELSAALALSCSEDAMYELQILCLLLVLALLGSLIADDSVNPACKADKRVAGAWFKVHGRLSNWNGNPTERIWIIGTKRMLGVRVDTDLPKALAEKMGDFDDVASGDFEVCPLTREQKGRMQIVCVASVSGVTVSKRKTSPQ